MRENRVLTHRGHFSYINALYGYIQYTNCPVEIINNYLCLEQVFLWNIKRFDTKFDLIQTCRTEYFETGLLYAFSTSSVSKIIHTQMC